VQQRDILDLVEWILSSGMLISWRKSTPWLYTSARSVSRAWIVGKYIPAQIGPTNAQIGSITTPKIVMTSTPAP
jgi:hypothetical protein